MQLFFGFTLTSADKFLREISKLLSKFQNSSPGPGERGDGGGFIFFMQGSAVAVNDDDHNHLMMFLICIGVLKNLTAFTV